MPHEIAYPACHLPVERPGSGLGVAAPEQDEFRILQDIGYHIRFRVHLADGFHPPGMFGAPVPAFPAIRVSRL